MSSVIRGNRRKTLASTDEPASTEQRSHAPLGKLLLDAGKLTEIDVNRVAVAQRQKNLRFGETAERLGLVSHEDVARALAQQFRYPYVTGESLLDTTLIAAYQPFSAAAESLRELRSQLLLRWSEEQRRSLAIISPRKRSGCSRLAANLAIVFAQLGERTLLIDANLRRPSQQALFGAPPGAGLSNFLAGRSELADVLRPVAPFENLHVVFAGTQPPNPQELVSRVTFRYLLEAAPKNFDVVIIDTPPILEFADAQIIAAAAGGCLLSARRHVTRLADIERAGAKFAPTPALLLGTAIVG
ncbi:MAG: chain length determinant protein tyrosine kinase EpsG [Gammaproteobacteria bacterium]|jgi:protein-tyrosine kinase|nr:chain length determinant protein tyrosine kinase EpsG [Gammaproteobacteria bacterium]